MLSRYELLGKAADDCLEELYTLVQPKVTWEIFKEECKIYSEKYKEWESIEENRPNITEYCGPKPYEFYYLPREVMKEVCDSYINAYKMDSQQELLDTIEILKNYCKEPIVDKWIEGENGDPGHRGYEHPDNLEKELSKHLSSYFGEEDGLSKEIAIEIKDILFKFLDMAGEFYNWNRDLNAFSMTVYLGPSPNSNKQAVIDNWKKYRNIDIEIDESIYKEEDYD